MPCLILSLLCFYLVFAKWIDAIEGDVWYNGAIRIECITN